MECVLVKGAWLGLKGGGKHLAAEIIDLVCGGGGRVFGGGWQQAGKVFEM